jgi:hypothetical protein
VRTRPAVSGSSNTRHRGLLRLRRSLTVRDRSLWPGISVQSCRSVLLSDSGCSLTGHADQVHLPATIPLGPSETTSDSRMEDVRAPHSGLLGIRVPGEFMGDQQIGSSSTRLVCRWTWALPQPYRLPVRRRSDRTVPGSCAGPRCYARQRPGGPG